MMTENVHHDCKYYHENDDLCLCYFELSKLAFGVSKKSDKCLGEVIYDD